MTERKFEGQRARWEELGDLASGGFRLVGGSPEVRKDARRWLKEHDEARSMVESDETSEEREDRKAGLKIPEAPTTASD